MNIRLLVIFSLVVIFAGTFIISEASAHLANGHHTIAIVYQPTDLESEEFKVTCKTNRDISEYPVFDMTVTSVPIDNYDSKYRVDGKVIYHSTDRDLNVKKNLILEDGFYIQTTCNVDSSNIPNGGSGYYIKTITSFDEIKDKKLQSNDYKTTPTITRGSDTMNPQVVVASCVPGNVDDSLTYFTMVVAYLDADKFTEESPFSSFREMVMISPSIDNRVTQNITLDDDTYLLVYCAGYDGTTVFQNYIIVKDTPLL